MQKPTPFRVGNAGTSPTRTVLLPTVLELHRELATLALLQLGVLLSWLPLTQQKFLPGYRLFVVQTNRQK
jgi:hypothetical protein